MIKPKYLFAIVAPIIISAMLFYQSRITLPDPAMKDTVIEKVFGPLGMHNAIAGFQFFPGNGMDKNRSTTRRAKELQDTKVMRQGIICLKSVDSKRIVSPLYPEIRIGFP